MISLRRLLERDDERGVASAFLRACSLLTEAIAMHAVSQVPSEYESFRDKVRRLRRAIEEPESTDALLVSTGQIIEAMEVYNRHIEAVLRLQTTEFHEIFRMLAQTIASIAQEGVKAGENLSHIEKSLETTYHLDDIRLLKTRLKESLEDIAAESVRQKEQAEKVAAGIQGHIETLQNELELTDSVTGLPSPVSAERALAQAIEEGRPAYAAVLSLERLDAINSRFGYAVGDRLMFLFAQEIAQRLSKHDRLFRWRGPTLIAMLERPGRMHDVRIETSHLAAIRQERSIDFQGRNVLLRLTARSGVVSLKDAGSLEKTLDAIHTFVAPVTEFS